MWSTLYFLSCRLLILVCACVVLQGCDRQEKAPAQGEGQTNRQIIKIGLIPEHNLFEQKKLYEPLLEYLSDELGATFESHILSRYGNIIENFNELGLDGAFMGSFTGAMAIKHLRIEPIARPQYVDGTSSYYGLVFVKKGSGIASAESMRGKRMVFVDRATTAGYLLPLAFLKSLGIADYKNWFSEFYFSGTHEDAILDVLNGQADIGAAKNTVFAQLATSDRRVAEELDILATSPNVPSNALLLKSDLPQELKKLVRDKLLSAHLTRKGKKALAGLKVDMFIETSGSDYQPVLDYAESIGLDLAKYQYQNN